jgi:hypothetical protein
VAFFCLLELFIIYIIARTAKTDRANGTNGSNGSNGSSGTNRVIRANEPGMARLGRFSKQNVNGGWIIEVFLLDL